MSLCIWGLCTKIQCLLCIHCLDLRIIEIRHFYLRMLNGYLNTILKF